MSFKARLGLILGFRIFIKILPLSFLVFVTASFSQMADHNGAGKCEQGSILTRSHLSRLHGVRNSPPRRTFNMLKISTTFSTGPSNDECTRRTTGTGSPVMAFEIGNSGRDAAHARSGIIPWLSKIRSMESIYFASSARQIFFVSPSLFAGDFHSCVKSYTNAASFTVALDPLEKRFSISFGRIAQLKRPIAIADQFAALFGTTNADGRPGGKTLRFIM